MTSLLESWTPLPYQVRGAKWLITHQHAGLSVRPGLRKTSTILAAFSTLVETGKARRMLVVAPLRPCYMVWPREVAKWREFAHLKCHVLHGKGLRNVPGDADIYIINLHSLDKLSSQLLKIIKIDVLAIDETTFFKNRKTSRFKTLYHVARTRAKYVWGMTGSLLSNGYADLWAQNKLIDDGASIGETLGIYRMRYLRLASDNYWDIRNEDARHRLADALADVWFSVSDDDELPELPERVVEPIFVALSEEQQEYYDSMEANAFIEFGEETETVAASQMAQAHRMQQIANGTVFLTDELGSRKNKGYRIVHEEKYSALADIVAVSEGRPLLVMYSHNSDREELLKRYPKARCLSETSPRESQEIIDKWNADKLPMVIAHPKSMSHGLNLQDSQCTTVVWFGNTRSWEDFDQTCRRVERSGSKMSHIYVLPIVTEGTLDEVIYQSTVVKGNTEGQFLGLLKEYYTRKYKNGSSGSHAELVLQVREPSKRNRGDLQMNEEEKMAQETEQKDNGKGKQPKAEVSTAALAAGHAEAARRRAASGTKDKAPRAASEKSKAKVSGKPTKSAAPKAKTKADAKAKPKGKAPANAPKAKAAKAKKTGEEMAIEVLVENPKRPGSRADEVFKMYSKCKTVSKFREAGGDMAYLRFDVQSKFVKLVPLNK